MLADMGFVGVVARQFNMLETVEGPVEIRPKVEVLQRRVGFQGGKVVAGLQRLEMGFADKRRPIAGRLKALANRCFAFRQLGAE